MKIKLILQVQHASYGTAEFHSVKELNENTPPINLMGLVTQHLIHVLMKMAHVMTNCYRNNLKFSDKVYDIDTQRADGLTLEEQRRRAAAIGAEQPAA